MVTTVDAGLYAALATVATITTALQAAVGLTPLSDSANIRRRKEASSPGQPEYDKARDDAGMRLRSAILLNVPALLVNGAVLASWLGIGIVHSGWALWLPWAAVVTAAVFLVTCAAIGSWNLNALARQ